MNFKHITTVNTHTALTSFRPHMIKRLSIALAAASFLLVQAACVSNVSSATKESNKDLSGSFDGVWLAKVKKTSGRQQMPGNWIVICDGRPQEFTITVDDGTAHVWHNRVKEKTYVANDGDFRFDLPIADSDRAGASAQIALKRRNRIIYGNFAKAKGRHTIGYEEFGNNGCTAVIDFVRKDAAS